MSETINRRGFFRRAWQGAFALMGVAGAWTSLDVLRSVPPSGLGGVIKTVPKDDVTETPLYVRNAQTYLVEIEGETIGLWQRCPHLGCRVAWCESSREFECACHGSAFNRAGEVRTGPSPRGMDRFAVEVSDGVIDVDTGDITEGVSPGNFTIDEPPQGPSCSGHV